MVTVWFLIALLAFPGIPSIQYKGYYAYHSKEECDMQRPHLENFIVEKEINKDIPAFYIETFCLEMGAFQTQLDKYREDTEKGIGLGGQSLGHEI